MGYGEEFAEHLAFREMPRHLGQQNEGYYRKEWVNQLLKMEDYKKLLNYLTCSLRPDVRLTEVEAKKYIFQNLIKLGLLPHPRARKLSEREISSLKAIIRNADCVLKGDGRFGNEDIKKEEKKVKPSNKAVFEVMVVDEEENEVGLFLNRGIYQEQVAVSFSYPHYIEQGFAKEKLTSGSSIFKKKFTDELEPTINMLQVFKSLEIALNNLLNADLLNEETYNGIMEGYKPFILEVLSFEAIESVIVQETGLRTGKPRLFINRKKNAIESNPL